MGPLILAVVSGAALYLALVYDGLVDIVCGLMLAGVGLYGVKLTTRGRSRTR